MSRPIDHALLDDYERTKGDPSLLPKDQVIDPDLWELMDGILLDLHLIRHGYADEAYARHLERRLHEVCADSGVAARLRRLEL